MTFSNFSDQKKQMTVKFFKDVRRLKNSDFNYENSRSQLRQSRILGKFVWLHFNFLLERDQKKQMTAEYDSKCVQKFWL